MRRRGTEKLTRRLGDLETEDGKTDRETGVCLRRDRGPRTENMTRRRALRFRYATLRTGDRGQGNHKKRAVKTALFYSFIQTFQSFGRKLAAFRVEHMYQDHPLHLFSTYNMPLRRKLHLYMNLG